MVASLIASLLPVLCSWHGEEIDSKTAVQVFLGRDLVVPIGWY